MTSPHSEIHSFEGPPHRISGPVLAGVIPGQPAAVVRRAVELAAGLGVGLVCAYVDTSTYEATRADGSHVLLPIDPDGDYDYVEETAEQIRSDLTRILGRSGVDWSFRSLTGEPAHALTGLAESLDASMIVVGTREPGLAHRLEELLVGSVAVHLVHHQHRPVLVVPLNPRPFDQQR
jgi:nucleotide-binding universal stress UspA family protein